MKHELIDTIIASFKHRHYTNPSSKRMQGEILEQLENLKATMEQMMLRKSNHILGCELEGYENIIRYRGFEDEANKLMEIASKLK